MNSEEPPRRPRSMWELFGRSLPRTEIIFFAQIFLIYAVVVVALVNLTREHSSEKLWIALLSSCLGYVLPNPSMNRQTQ